MSFLLDQLKKSGKKRQIELAIIEKLKKSEDMPKTQAGSGHQSVPEISSPGFKIHQKFFYLIIGVFVISFGLFLWSKYPVVPGPQDNVQQKASLEKVNPPSAVAIKATDMPHESAIAKKPVTTALKEKPINNETGAINRSPEQKQATTDEKTYAKAISEVKSEPNKIQGLVDISELPAQVKSSLPKIKISSHLYKKDSPLVSINGRIMTESYNVTNDLYLEEITPEGVIMSYRNHRFSIKVQ